jgi:hypothetical protein
MSANANGCRWCRIPHGGAADSPFVDTRILTPMSETITSTKNQTRPLVLLDRTQSVTAAFYPGETRSNHAAPATSASVDRQTTLSVNTIPHLPVLVFVGRVGSCEFTVDANGYASRQLMGN